MSKYLDFFVFFIGVITILIVAHFLIYKYPSYFPIELRNEVYIHEKTYENDEKRLQKVLSQDSK